MAGWAVPAGLRGVRPSSMAPEVLAGLTLAAIGVPEQMATARLAGMPAAAGLYAFVAGSLAFALLGRDRRLSVGADSTIAPIVFGAVSGIALLGSTRYAHLVSVLALLVGAFVAAVGLLRLGWIADFLPTPAVMGVLAGIAVQIAIHELPAVLGLPGGGTSTVSRVRALVHQLGQINGWSLGIALVVLGLVVVAERVDRRIPGALVGVVGSTIFVVAFGLRSHGVALLGSLHGNVRGTAPSLGWSAVRWSDVRQLLLPAATIAFLCVAQTAATARSGDSGGPAAAEFDRDLVGVGAGSLAAGLIGSFAVNASPPRTAVVRAAGGRSQLTNVVGAVVALGVVLWAAGALKNLPQATLGAILLFVATKLVLVRELRSVLRFERVEFGLAVLATLVVVFFGIEQGVVVAMLLSLADRTRRAARPRDIVLGREVGTSHWIPPDVGRQTEQLSGVLVYLLYAPLWYANADFVAARIRRLIDTADHPVRTLILDADAVADIDYTAARKIGELATQLRQEGVTTAVARASHLVHHDLKHSGLLRAIGPDHLYASVEEAVEAAVKDAKS